MKKIQNYTTLQYNTTHDINITKLYRYYFKLVISKNTINCSANSSSLSILKKSSKRSDNFHEISKDSNSINYCSFFLDNEDKLVFASSILQHTFL